jgi:hypothetical protein
MADRIITQFMRHAGRLCGRDGHDRSMIIKKKENKKAGG